MMNTAKQTTKTKIVTAVFVVVSLFDIAGIIFHIDMLRLLFKPLLMLTLLWLYLVSYDKINRWYIAGLLFSFLGDVLLLFQGEMFFMLGLISFLIAHFIYIKMVLGWLKKPKLKATIISAVPFLIIFIALINLLKDNLNDLFVPVVIYGITISIMGLVSVLYYLNSKSKSALFMAVGATFFIFSDSILAINKFYATNEILPILIMITYLTAQYLIYRAVITREDN